MTLIELSRNGAHTGCASDCANHVICNVEALALLTYQLPLDADVI